MENKTIMVPYQVSHSNVTYEYLVHEYLCVSYYNSLVNRNMNYTDTSVAIKIIFKKRDSQLLLIYINVGSEETTGEKSYSNENKKDSRQKRLISSYEPRKRKKVRSDWFDKQKAPLTKGEVCGKRNKLKLKVGHAFEILRWQHKRMYFRKGNSIPRHI